jgi:hypothetical protein
MNGKEFSQWMEEVGISLTEAAELFGVSEQTLYNWRSSIGVPDRKLEWVRARMEEFLKKSTRGSQLDRVVLEITDDQFAAWNAAALEDGLLLKEWAIQTLDDAALNPTGSSETFNPLESLKVAEPDTDYLPKKDGTA